MLNIMQNSRRIISSTMNKQDEVQNTQLHAKFPKFDVLPSLLWKNLAVDVADLCEKYMNGFNGFKSIIRVDISGVFKLRRVFLYREGQIDHDNQLSLSNDRHLKVTDVQSKKYMEIPDSLNFPRKCKMFQNVLVNAHTLNAYMSNLATFNPKPSIKSPSPS